MAYPGQVARGHPPALKRMDVTLDTRVALQLAELQHALIAAEGDPQAILAGTAEAALLLGEATSVAIEILEGGALVCRASCGVAIETIGAHIPSNGSLSGTCLRTLSAEIAREVGSDPRYADEPGRFRGIRTIMALPLRAGADTMGVLKLLYRDPEPDAEGTLILMRVVAGILEAALRARPARAAESEVLRLLAAQGACDALTGLPNRLALEKALGLRVEGAGHGGSHMALLLVSVNEISQINTTLGYRIGDMVLQESGTRLARLLGKADRLFWVGGDTFGLLIDHAEAEEAERIARTALGILAMPMLLAERRITVGSSIGIALTGEAGEESEALLRRASGAAEEARGMEEGYALYAPEQIQQGSGHFTLLNDLRDALAEGQFSLHYQPMISLPDMAIDGVEALIRWRHPELGMIPPAHFIPLAEQTGLIDLITFWVLETALRQWAAWRRRGLIVQLAVNISMRTLHDMQLPETVTWLLRRYAVPPERVTFEVTESVLMTNPARAIPVLGALAGTGVRIAIDDFGTGYSSLSYLKRLPVQLIKIDRSFIRGMGTDRRDSPIIRSIVGLAHDLGLRVVAEGIEDHASMELLTRMGCDLAQGYLIGRPLDAENFDRWLACRGAWLERVRGG